MIVKVPDAIDEAQPGTLLLLHGASGRAGRADSQTGTQCGRGPQIRAIRLYCAAHTDVPRIFRPTGVVALLCVACSVRQRERPTDLSSQSAPTARSVRPGERSKVEPFTDRRGPKGLALCAVRAWSTGASPLAHPIAPGLARGAWGKHRQAPGAGVALS